MGASSARQEYTLAARTNEALSQRAYDIGLGALGPQIQQINQGLQQGGEPGYLQRAFAGARTGATESLLSADQAETGGRLAASSRVSAGGNLMSNLTPSQVGAKIAEALYSSRTNEAVGKFEQFNKLMAMGLGQSAQAGSSAIGAGAAQLEAARGLPTYNPTYANVLTAANLANLGYQGYYQAYGPPSWKSV